MKGESLIGDDKLAVVQLTKSERWVRLALWLADEFSGGDLARFGRDATVTFEGMDELSSSYASANWLSGVASGVLYAFRTLCIPRQRIVVTELSGRLEAADMEAIAIAAAVAVSTLANKPLSKLAAETWTIQAGLTERSPSDSTEQDDVAERPH